MIMGKAFINWFKQTFKDRKDEGISHLISLAGDGSGVWDYLERTGDKEYTFDTFSKAYDLLMAENT
jgi:hypothetical protein